MAKDNGDDLSLQTTELDGNKSPEEIAENLEEVIDPTDESNTSEDRLNNKSDKVEPSVSPCPTYKDMATWTVEDDMPSPMDSSTPVDSPDLSQIRRFKQYRHEESEGIMPLPPHPYLNSPTETNLNHPLPQTSTCFTVSSQLQSREARLYENVPPNPTSKSGIESLGLIFHPPQAAQSHPSPHTEHGATNEFLSVSDFLNGGGGFGGPPSRSSWVDSGRESLSFDGESGLTPNNSNSNNSNNSGRNNCGSYFYAPPQQDFSPSHHTPYPSKLRSSNGEQRRSRRDRLVRQKHALDEFSYQFQPNSASPTGTSGGGVNSMCSYLAVPSPRRSVLSSGIATNAALAAVSPISLHRHPNAQALMLQENKRTRGLIPGAESPYAVNSESERRSHHTDSHGGSFNEHSRLSRLVRSPSRGLTSSSSGTKYKVQHSTGCARYKNDSFDYGELPSHQMFPKRHLLGPNRQFSQPYSVQAVPPPNQPQNHRSFPANLLR